MAMGSGVPDFAVAVFFDIVFYEKGYAGGGLCRRSPIQSIIRCRVREPVESEISRTRCLISFTYMCQPHGRAKARQCVPCDFG